MQRTQVHTPSPRTPIFKRQIIEFVRAHPEGVRTSAIAAHIGVDSKALNRGIGDVPKIYCEATFPELRNSNNWIYPRQQVPQEEPVVEDTHMCIICHEEVEHEYQLVGFGCCTAKLCTGCIVQLPGSQCPGCRQPLPFRVTTHVRPPSPDETVEALQATIENLRNQRNEAENHHRTELLQLTEVISRIRSRHDTEMQQLTALYENRIRVLTEPLIQPVVPLAPWVDPRPQQQINRARAAMMRQLRARIQDRQVQSEQVAEPAPTNPAPPQPQTRVRAVARARARPITT